jgi:hypothetical protein
MRIAEDLNFDVFGARDVPLEKHIRSTERGACLALCLREFGLELVGTVHDTHAASAAAKTRLDHQRIADACGFASNGGRIGQCPIGSRNRGHSCRVRQTFGRGFVAKCVEVFRRRPDERNPGLLARACKRRALGEEPVARMNRVDALRLRDGNDGLNVQIRPDRFAALDGNASSALKRCREKRSSWL